MEEKTQSFKLQGANKTTLIGCGTFIALLVLGYFVCDSLTTTSTSSSTPTPPKELIKSQNLPITSIDQVTPLKDTLKKLYRNNFYEIHRQNVVVWMFEHKNEEYSGLVSYNFIPGNKTEILKSEYNFTIHPKVKNNPQKFENFWRKGLNIASLWIFYSTDHRLTFNDIVPLFNQTLQQAENNYKERGLSFRFNTVMIKGFEIFLNCDVDGIFTFRVEKQ